jgi:hypothetical protein
LHEHFGLQIIAIDFGFPEEPGYPAGNYMDLVTDHRRTFWATLLTIAAAISFHFDRLASRKAVVPLYSAALLCVAGLIFTIKAAPLMLGIREVNEPAALQNAFEGFRYWGNIRGACQVFAFAAQLWALGVLASRSSLDDLSAARARSQEQRVSRARLVGGRTQAGPGQCRRAATRTRSSQASADEGG